MDENDHLKPKYIIGAVFFSASFVFLLTLFIYGELVGQTYYAGLVDSGDPDEEEILSPGELISLPGLSLRTIESVRAGSGSVLNSGPLRVSLRDFLEVEDLPEVFLSDHNVFVQTNFERNNYGLGSFSRSSQLDQIALQKLNDMATQNYFAHVSPQGLDIGDVASRAGYQYAVIAENLALGDFLSEADLLSAWMASPGHRANILNGNFTHLGLAVRRIVFDGEMVWLGVQVFAKPLSLCRRPNDDLRGQILTNRAEIESEIEALADLKELIDGSLNSTDQSRLGDLVDSYNARARSLNNLIRVTEASIVAYNSEVRTYNRCVGY